MLVAAGQIVADDTFIGGLQKGLAPTGEVIVEGDLLHGIVGSGRLTRARPGGAG